MRIIISPAKKMLWDTDTLPWRDLPLFLEDTRDLLDRLRGMDYGELKALWRCNDQIAKLNFERLQRMDLHRNLTPAILAYDGIQYRYMAPGVFTYDELDYIKEHLRILSGFYGILKPFDGVTPYRLEMQAKAAVQGTKNLYEFWGGSLYEEVIDSDRTIINLASKEYSKCIEKYLQPEDIFITCIFGELQNGRVCQKGTEAKMARGEMVRYMAENRTADPEEMKQFDRLGYHFCDELSSQKEYIFLK